jgi:hypothetical protein
MRGRPDLPRIADRPAWWWIQLWRRCHELRWAGDNRAYWGRIEWPEPGPVSEQLEIVVQVFAEISEMKAEILTADLKKMQSAAPR